MRVLVTGAGGRTGRLIYERLKASPELFHARGLVRTEESKAALGGEVFVADIARDNLDEALSGCDAVVVATSATPKMAGPPKEGERPVFAYPAGGLPEVVDWVGQRATIDAAKAAGVKHVVVIGSRGGTDPNHMLNKSASACAGLPVLGC